MATIISSLSPGQVASLSPKQLSALSCAGDIFPAIEFNCVVVKALTCAVVNPVIWVVLKAVTCEDVRTATSCFVSALI